VIPKNCIVFQIEQILDELFLGKSLELDQRNPTIVKTNLGNYRLCWF